MMLDALADWANRAGWAGCADSAAAAASAALAALILAGCAVGPDYRQPAAAIPAGYKEAQGWVPAAPADALDRGPWWTLFGDPALDELAARIEVSNQNVAAAAAAYAQARALVGEQRAALFPAVSVSANADRSGGTSAATATRVASSGRTANNFQAAIGASWEPDVWGRIGRSIDSAGATAQASEGDLASATLSAQGELATNYFSLRQTDAQLELLAQTTEAFRRTLQITQNRYAAGIAAKSDVLQAQTQLANAQADQATLVRQRAQFEHAIAVLVGQAPGDFTLTPAAWRITVPEVPVGIPSTLLQRRPDIAGAERRVAAANEQIGIARSAYFPSLSLNASDGLTATRIPDLIAASTSAWSLGLSVAQVVFNAGATRERVAQAQAAYDSTVARYRQTVLVALQGVEDQLTATRILAQQEQLRREASRAADEAEQQFLNRYRAGQVSFTEVANAQTTALNARRSLIQVQADRQNAAVGLIQALGGGWRRER